MQLREKIVVAVAGLGFLITLLPACADPTKDGVLALPQWVFPVLWLWMFITFMREFSR